MTPYFRVKDLTLTQVNVVYDFMKVLTRLDMSEIADRHKFLGEALRVDDKERVIKDIYKGMNP